MNGKTDKADKNEMKARLIAAAVTLCVALLFGVACLLVSLSPRVAKDDVRKAVPSLMAMDEADDFLDPEEFMEPPVEVEDAGEPDPSEIQDDTPAPTPAGEPDKGEPNERVSTTGNNARPNKSAEKLVTQKQESPVKHTNPSKKEEPDSRISSEMGNKFNPHNGKPTGKETGTAGSSSTGSGAGSAVGVLDGKRKMLSCNNKFSVKLSRQIVVKVRVTVNDKGRVVKARCVTNVDAALAKKLERESLGSTWTPKAGAPDKEGTITWTLKPAIK